MKKIAMTVLLFISTVCNVEFSYATNQKPLDQIVAVVNDELISKSELEQTMITVKAQFKHEQVSMPADLTSQVLDQLINKRLQLQLASQANISVPAADIDKTIRNIAEQNNMTVTEFYDRLKQEGLSKKTYRKEMTDQLTIQKMQQQEISRHLIISSQEVDSYLRSRIWESTAPKEYRVIDIVLPIADTASPEELAIARNKAKEVAEGLRKGTTLQTIAKELVHSKYALQSEDLGFLKLTELPSIFVDEVSRMHKHDIGDPISAPNGFHILQLADVGGGSSKQAQPSRKQVENLLLQRKFQEGIQNWISKIRSQAYIVKQL